MAQDTTRQHHGGDTTKPSEPPNPVFLCPETRVPGFTISIHTLIAKALQRHFFPHRATAIRKQRMLSLSIPLSHTAENFTLTSTLPILSQFGNKTLRLLSGSSPKQPRSFLSQ